MNLTSVKEVYGRWAKYYDISFGTVSESSRKKAFEIINKHNSKNVLEIGVGTGLSLPKYNSSHIVTGVDICPEMLAIANKRLEEANLTDRVSLSEMDAENLTFPDNSFDIVNASFVISVFPHPEKVLSEIQRVCKPGGLVIFLNHFSNKKNPLAAVDWLLSPFASRIGWEPLIDNDICVKNPSFVVEEQKKVGLLHLFTLLCCRNEKNASSNGKNGHLPPC